FFFQAEDGIRDFHVTGVQTCALPIYVVLRHEKRWRERSCIEAGEDFRDQVHRRAREADQRSEPAGKRWNGRARALLTELHRREQIGRASCRERAWISGEDGS